MAYLTRHDLSWRTAAVSPKAASLVLLTFQNSALILMMHYSRIMPLVDGQRYLPSTAVLISELIKLAISLTVAVFDMANKNPNIPLTSVFAPIAAGVFSGDSWKMAIPASLYTLQNTLQYISCSNLDASTFQITYQLKILTTAVFSVLLLGRRLSARKWISLLLLTVGVALVQAPGASTSNEAAGDSGSKEWIPKVLFPGPRAEPDDKSSVLDKNVASGNVASDTPHMNATVGLVAVLIACFSSGLAGVYFEKVLKDAKSGSNKPQISLWIRNVQLSFYSLFPAIFVGIIYKDGDLVMEHGFFAGYNSIVWATIGLQAVGGVIVALVIAYSNNISKNFATSISIIISFFASMFLFDLTISFRYFLGIMTVLGATWLYNIPEQSRLPPPTYEDEEKQGASRDSRSYEAYSDDPSAATLQVPSNGGISTSRPGTPTNERHHYRLWSARKQDKRDA